MSCPSCGWPTAEAEVISRHRTSEGTVRYLRCVCGQVTIQLEGSAREAAAAVAGWPGAGAHSPLHLSWEKDTTGGTGRGK